MPAPIGNKFWKARSSHGREPIFADPETLWSASCEYFEWVSENPLFEAKAFAFQGIVTQESLPKMRAMTIDGLCNFLDISFPTWDNYRKKEDFFEICSRVETIIRQQKYEGAAAELLNPSIIARDLGLADRKELGSIPGNNLKLEVSTLDLINQELELDSDREDQGVAD